MGKQFESRGPCEWNLLDDFLLRVTDLSGCWAEFHNNFEIAYRSDVIMV